MFYLAYITLCATEQNIRDAKGKKINHLYYLLLYISLLQMKLIFRTCTSSRQLDTQQKVDDQCYFSSSRMHVIFFQKDYPLLCLQQHHTSKKMDGHVGPYCPGDPSLPLPDNVTLSVWASYQS